MPILIFLVAAILIVLIGGPALLFGIAAAPALVIFQSSFVQTFLWILFIFIASIVLLMFYVIKNSKVKIDDNDNIENKTKEIHEMLQRAQKGVDEMKNKNML